MIGKESGVKGERRLREQATGHAVSLFLIIIPRTSKLTQPAPLASCREGSFNQAHSKGGTMRTLVGETRSGEGRCETSGI